MISFKMIEVDRLSAILKAHNLTPTGLGRMINLSHSKMSRVMSGQQKLPAEAVGEIIKLYGIHPNWIFGYEGDPNVVMYLDDLVPKSELEKKEREKMELERENAQLYKKLALAFEQKAAENESKYEKANKVIEEKEANIEGLKNN